MMSLHDEADLRDLWYEVNDSKSIVIYCGAGVTADRTGVGWLGLINRVADKLMECPDSKLIKKLETCFDNDKDDEKLQSARKAVKEYLNDEDIPLEVKATMVEALAKNENKENNDAIQKVFAEALYRDSGWHRGRTLQKLVDFIVISACMGKSISIITTNYDTYIERAILERLEFLDDPNLSEDSELEFLDDPNLSEDLELEFLDDPNLSEDSELEFLDDPNLSEDLELEFLDDPNLSEDLELEFLDDPNLSEDSESKKPLPKLSYVAYKRVNSGPNDEVREVEERDSLFDGDKGGSSIEVNYIHGSITENGDLRGSLVFSERNYADGHDRTVKKLIKWFEKGPTIIVGASLNDVPLVRSLLGFKRTIKKGSESSYAGIYAILKRRTIASEAISDQFQLSRAEALGIKLLMFDSYNDIPDIFSNLIALCAQGVDGYGGKLPCELALEDWIGQTAKFSREISEYGYEMSSIVIDEIFKKLIGEKEKIKIEFWFVGYAEGSSDKKVLRVWTNSVGPTFTTGLRREEDVLRDNEKKVASVKAYSSGIPEIISIDKLNVGFDEKNNKDASVGRWKTFLAVPLSVPSKKYNVDIVVGVVTLASTYKISDSNFFDSKSSESAPSSGLDSKINNKRLIVVDYMRVIGRNLAETILNWKDYVNLKSIHSTHATMRGKRE